MCASYEQQEKVASSYRSLNPLAQETFETFL
jgi:hypothetical protein